MMRILLFALTQAAVLAIVSVVGSLVLHLLGISLPQGAYGRLLILCAVYGCAGSLISLALSKTMCKKSYGVRTIAAPRDARERALVSTVSELAAKAGVGMPEVGIYDSRDPNAFATGASRDSALVAVSSGLLSSLNAEEVRAVLGHEISHVKNGDMVTMTLLQGVLNTFVYFFSYVASQLLVSALRGRGSQNSGASASFYLVNSLMQVVFGVGATLILMWFSRFREFRADAGSAALTSPDSMIGALQALQRAVRPASGSRASMRALCISGPSLASLFASHPPLEKRIEALRGLR